MGARLIFILCLSTLVSCTPLSSNFGINPNLKAVNFNCRSSFSGDDLPLFDVYFDTLLSFQVINKSKKEGFLFHDRTFVIPFYYALTTYPSKEDQTIIRYFDNNKTEILGRFSTIYIDSSFVDSEYFSVPFIDTTTYKIKSNDIIQISQKITLPFNKNGLLISISEEDCKKVGYLKFCLSKGKKNDNNNLYGLNCSDFIKVVHK